MKDPISKELRNEENRHIKIYQMKYKQRERLIDKIDRWTVELSRKYQNAKSKRTQKEIEKKQIEATKIRTNLNSINNETKLFDSGNRNSIYQYDNILSSPVKRAIKEIQKSGFEYAGGINIESKENPEKLVVRKGTKEASKPDLSCDIVIHSHPNRELTNQKTLKDQEIYFDNLLSQAKTQKEKEKIKKLKLELNAPFDYLASKPDIEFMNKMDKNQTHLILSKNRVNVLTQRDAKLIDSVDKDYYKHLMKLSAARTITHQPKNMKEAEKMIGNYRKEIKRGYKSFTDNYGLDAEIKPNGYIPYRLQSDNLRSSRRQYFPEEEFLIDEEENQNITKNTRKSEQMAKIQKKPKKQHKPKTVSKPNSVHRKKEEKSNWFIRLFR